MPTPFEATNLIRQAARLGAALSPKSSAGEQVGVSTDKGAAALGAQRLLDTPISQIQAQQRVGYAPGAVQASGLTVDELAAIYPLGLTAQMANEEARQFDAKYPLEQQKVNNDTQQVNLNTRALPSEINLRAAQTLELQGRPREARALLALELDNRLKAIAAESDAKLGLENTRTQNDLSINAEEQRLKNEAMRLEQAFKLQQPMTVSPDSQALMLPNIGYDAQGNPFVNGFTPATVNSVPGDPTQDRAGQQKAALGAWDKPDASAPKGPGELTPNARASARAALETVNRAFAAEKLTGIVKVGVDENGNDIYSYRFADATKQDEYDAAVSAALDNNVKLGGMTPEQAAQYKMPPKAAPSASGQTSSAQTSSSVSSYINSALGQKP